jgi:signal transduction histidine kinase
MQERLRAYVEGRTAMLAAIAHDLRTPLTGLRLRAEAAPEPERSRMAADIARMDAMITQVLAFATASRPERFTRRSISPGLHGTARPTPQS